jgi:transcriptional regulator with XRE-family HTH domain
MRTRTENSIRIGKIISTRRKELKIKQKDAAKLIGISLSTLIRYENGEVQYIPNDIVTKINEVFALDIPFFIDKYNLLGNRYGMLIVTKYSGTRGANHKYWECKCDCGNETVARGSHLIAGNVKSCGCIRGEWMKQNSSQNGLSRSRIYNIWRSMLKRCYLPTNPSYIHYGGRGISVCDEWKNNFQSFYKWSIENGYKEKLTIDRIDVNGNYEPSNCRWATPKQQANNRTNTTLITLNGETHSASEWSEILKIPRVTIKNRLRKGMNIEKVLSVQTLKKRREEVM